MKVCSDCNKQFSDDTEFCPDCGRELQSQGGGGRARSRGSSNNPQAASNRSRSSGRSRGSQSAGSSNPGGSGSRSRGGGQSRNQGARGQGGRSRQGRSGSAGGPSAPGNRSDQEDLIGRTFFGEYNIVQRLGEGGMGAVYLAEHNKIDQNIALKVLHAESAESDEIVQRFHREARVISMLSHPNIVRVFIFGRTDDDLLFMAMEHVEGVELREHLDGTPMDELRAIKIMKQTCSALAAAHDMETPVIHRDLKPENILLTEFRGEEDYVKILDFGIAKIKHPEGQQGPQLTQAGIVYGTPEYLSPEQAQAEDLDYRTDIYALGCILFEMMTGRVPFDAEASVEILKQKVFEDPPRPTEFAPVASTMEEIIMRAMAKDRENRFGGALEMYDALVARENELQRERKLSEEETYVPGGELTGVHRAVDPSENPIDAVQEQAEAAQQAVANPGAPGASGTNMAESGTSSTDTAGPGGTGPARTSNPGGQTGGGGHSNTPTAPTPGADASQSNQIAGQGQQHPQNLNAAPTQPHQQAQAGQNGLVRYLLIGAVVVLGVAVLSLAGYITFMLVR